MIIGGEKELYVDASRGRSCKGEIHEIAEN